MFLHRLQARCCRLCDKWYIIPKISAQISRKGVWSGGWGAIMTNDRVVRDRRFSLF